MATYTIEDIELIRSKSGISYQEALSLLEYHNGNVARALVDLERNGRINPQAARSSTASSTPAGAQKKSGAKSGLMDILTKLYRARLKISKDETPVLNMSALFGIAGLIFAPHLLILGAIVSLVLGYKFSFVKSDPAFAGENLERMVRSAADNVKSSVNDFTRGFQEGASGSSTAGQNAAPAGSQNAAQSSYYSAPAASYRANVPTMNVPVQVEGQDGSVTVMDDAEGFTSATIE